MNKVYPLTTEKSWKSAMIDADKLLLLNTDKADEEKFMAAWNATGVKSWLSSKKEISIAEITSLAHKEVKAADLTITHGNKKDRISFAATDDLEEMVGIIAKANRLTSQVKSMSIVKAAGGWMIGLVVTGVLGWLMYGYATGDMTYSTTGRRRGTGKLLYELAQKMGPELVLAVSVAVGAFFAYKIYSNFKNPPNEVVYE
jgi:hypothetical protein